MAIAEFWMSNIWVIRLLFEVKRSSIIFLCCSYLITTIMFDFTIRIHQFTGSGSTLGLFQNLWVSGYKIIGKPNKFGGFIHHKHKGIETWFDYKRIYNTGGSNSYPVIGFRGKYLDIHFKNFPRFPIVDEVSETSISYVEMLKKNLKLGYTPNRFSKWHEYRKVELLNLIKH